MALRNVVLEGDEILRKKARAVTEINERITILLDDMWETLEAHNGIGLAAPQVGVLRRVVVIDTGEDGVRLELINPKVLAESGTVEGEEGCLSLPGLVGAVIRPEKVTLEAQNRQGETVVVEGEGLLAKAIAHEIDHLEGVLFTDKALRVEELGADDDDGDEA
jgi:peptide deformylase